MKSTDAEEAFVLFLAHTISRHIHYSSVFCEVGKNDIKG